MLESGNVLSPAFALHISAVVNSTHTLLLMEHYKHVAPNIKPSLNTMNNKIKIYSLLSHNFGSSSEVSMHISEKNI